MTPTVGLMKTFIRRLQKGRHFVDLVLTRIGYAYEAWTRNRLLRHAECASRNQVDSLQSSNDASHDQADRMSISKSALARKRRMRFEIWFRYSVNGDVEIDVVKCESNCRPSVDDGIEI